MKKLVTIPITGNNGIIFANYFFKRIGDENEYVYDVPAAEKYSEKYSLNTLDGRANRQKYIADTYGVGFIQTGNMTMHIWQNKTDDEILIGEQNKLEYLEGSFDDNDKPNKPFHKVYKDRLKELKSKYNHIGEISCEVWRIEFMDTDKVTDGILDRNPAYNDGKDHTIAKVSPGVYELTEPKWEKDNDIRPFATWYQLKKIA